MNSVLLVLFLTFFMANATFAEMDLEKQLTGKSFQKAELVPVGYVASAETKGDLNGDGTDEVALIIRENSTSKEGDEFRQQYLLIFKGVTPAKYVIWKIGRHHFVETNAGFMEPNGVGTFEIKKGVLTIETSLALSSGGWGAGGCTMKWREEKNGFRLIGLTVVDFSRSCACGTTVDTNFLTGSKIITSDRSSSGEQLPTERVKKVKEKSKTVFWEQFDYTKFCN